MHAAYSYIFISASCNMQFVCGVSARFRDLLFCCTDRHELIMQIICLKPIPRRSHRTERPDDCLFENRSTSHVPHSETLESFLLTQLIICRWLDFVIQQERIPTLRRFTIKPEPSGGCDYSIKGRQNCLNTLCLQRHSSTS